VVSKKRGSASLRNGAGWRYLSMADRTGTAAMPHCSFTISRGGQSQPSSASDCPDDDAAKKEAAGMFANMARDISSQLQSVCDRQMDVADLAAKTIFKIEVTAKSE
jgi:hypothetical protein